MAARLGEVLRNQTLVGGKRRELMRNKHEHWGATTLRTGTARFNGTAGKKDRHVQGNAWTEAGKSPHSCCFNSGKIRRYHGEGEAKKKCVVPKSLQQGESKKKTGEKQG